MAFHLGPGTDIGQERVLRLFEDKVTHRIGSIICEPLSHPPVVRVLEVVGGTGVFEVDQDLANLLIRDDAKAGQFLANPEHRPNVFATKTRD